MNGSMDAADAVASAAARFSGNDCQVKEIKA